MVYENPYGVSVKFPHLTVYSLPNYQILSLMAWNDSIVKEPCPNYELYGIDTPQNDYK